MSTPTLRDRLAGLMALPELVLPADFDRRGMYHPPTTAPAPPRTDDAVPRTPGIALDPAAKSD